MLARRGADGYCDVRRTRDTTVGRRCDGWSTRVYASLPRGVFGPSGLGLLRSAAMAKRKPLTKAKLQSIRDALLEERAQLLEQVADLDAEADVKNWRDAGFDDDPADSGSASFERETAQSLSNHARNLLGQIDDAVRRIDAGTYGPCERCGKLIEAARLDALPYATLCMECKRRDETGR